MFARAFRLFAVSAALTFAAVSSAAAGWWGAPATSWGCAPSGCTPLLPSFYSYGYSYYGYYGHGCCPPVAWGCGCGGLLTSVPYGFAEPYAPTAPIYVVPQGPLYSAPLTGYTYPVVRYQRNEVYPYVSGYGTRYNGYRYRPYFAPRARTWRGYSEHTRPHGRSAGFDRARSSALPRNAARRSELEAQVRKPE